MATPRSTEDTSSLKGQVALLMVTLVALLPFAAAGNVFSDPVCVLDACAPTALCVNGVLCQPTTCDPVMGCSADLQASRSCALNETIDGETCTMKLVVDVGLQGRTLSGTPAPVPALPGSSLRGDALVAHGDVQREPLFHEWTSDQAALSGSVAGIPLGSTTMRLYASSIEAEGKELRKSFVLVERSGPEGSARAEGSLVLLDAERQECFVLTQGPQALVADCQGLP